jgi:hypothetical protein
LPAHSGAITGTKAHQHSAPSADGGFLSDNITGRTGAGNGSLVMYDAGSIAQDLAAGNLNDVLTMGAAQPAWSAPTPASAAYEFISSSTLGAPATSISLSFAAVNAADVAGFALFFNGGVNATGTELAVRLEGNTSANYSMQRLDMTGGTGTFSSWTNESHWKPYRASVGAGRVFGQMYIQADQTSQTPNILMTSTFVGSAGQCVYSGNLNITSTSLSEVEIYSLDGGGHTIQSGSTLSIFKINI